jgi:hypothetical protein
MTRGRNLRVIRPWTSAVLVALACASLRPGSVRAGDAPRANAAPEDSASVSAAAEPARPATHPETGTYLFPSRAARFEDWAWNALGPTAVAGDATTAAWGQWVSDEPAEWPHRGGDLGHRFGVAAATTAITETSLSLLSAAMHQDACYYRSPRSGLRPRVLHAMRMTFMARRADGTAEFSLAKTAAPFVGPVVTRTTLYPERYSYRDGLLSGAYALLMNAGWNLAREFVLKAPGW